MLIYKREHGRGNTIASFPSLLHDCSSLIPLHSIDFPSHHHLSYSFKRFIIHMHHFLLNSSSYTYHKHPHTRSNILILFHSLVSFPQVGIMQRCGKFNRLVEVLSLPITTSFPLFLFVVCYDHCCLLLTFSYTIFYLTHILTYSTSHTIHTTAGLCMLSFPLRNYGWSGVVTYSRDQVSLLPSHS